jgi:hypothetical protein
MNHDQAIETKFPMRYVLGELAAADRDEFEEHLADCSNCMNDVWMATTFAANAKEVFRDGEFKPAKAQGWAWLRWPLPAFAVSAALNVALAIGLGYGALRVYPALRAEIAELSEPGAVDVVPVRGVVRDASGGLQVVKASGRLIVLSFDLPQRYDQYVYSIADGRGRVVMSGEIPYHGADSLNLRVPVGRLPLAKYTATVTGIAGSRHENLGVCLLEVDAH